MVLFIENDNQENLNNNKKNGFYFIDIDDDDENDGGIFINGHFLNIVLHTMKKNSVCVFQVCIRCWAFFKF